MHAKTVATHYAQMAPVAEYLDTDVEAETALARSAAPAAVSGNATVLVLKRSGYLCIITNLRKFLEEGAFIKRRKEGRYPAQGEFILIR
jgi:hypothetical protein